MFTFKFHMNLNGMTNMMK